MKHRTAKAILSEAVRHAFHHGPVIVEVWTCPGCRKPTYSLHAFCEVVSCVHCNHRIPSKVPLYRFAMEKAADER